MIYHYTLPWVVLDQSDPSAPKLVAGRTDGILLDRDGMQIDATTPLGMPTQIVTSSAGTTVPFQATVPAGRVRFGNIEAAVFADENMSAADQAAAAQQAAEDALASIQHIADTATEITYLYREGDDIRVSQTPVVEGGGRPRITADGDVYVTFPI